MPDRPRKFVPESQDAKARQRRCGAHATIAERGRSEVSRILASTLTARSRTTLPSDVRKALGLRAGDRISYAIEADRVVIRKLAQEGEDPALAGFLDFLDRDIERTEDRVLFATPSFARYLEELTVGTEVDYDAPIEGDFQF